MTTPAAFCSACGSQMSGASSFCTVCGAPVASLPPAAAGNQNPYGAPHPGSSPPPFAPLPMVSQQYGQPTPYGMQPGPMGYVVRPPKDKTVAILLAVFLSFWTWLYTFDRDKNKFWTGLGVALGSSLLGLALVPLLIVPLGIWIWAIVDVAQKPAEYYTRFPAG